LLTPRIIMLLGAVVVLTVLVTSCSNAVFLFANAPTAFGSFHRHGDLAYGADARQRLDVYTPRGAAHRPVVIFWYGGTWVKGSKADYRFVGAALAERGFVAVLPDYRLYPKVTFPAFCEDGAQALAWVEAHAQEFGGDPHRIVLMGHSAGAHMAAFVAYNRAFDEQAGADPKAIVGFIGLSGPYALVPDTPELHATFPAPYMDKDWQPVRFVDARSPPTLLLHGLADKEVYPKHTLALNEALLRNHVRVQMELYPHAHHADTVAPFALLARHRSPAYENSVAFIESVTRSDPSP
jgi:acetyl esterase/lipase